MGASASSASSNPSSGRSAVAGAYARVPSVEEIKAVAPAPFPPVLLLPPPAVLPLPLQVAAQVAAAPLPAEVKRDAIDWTLVEFHSFIPVGEELLFQCILKNISPELYERLFNNNVNVDSSEFVCRLENFIRGNLLVKYAEIIITLDRNYENGLLHHSVFRSIFKKIFPSIRMVRISMSSKNATWSEPNVLEYSIDGISVVRNVTQEEFRHRVMMDVQISQQCETNRVLNELAQTQRDTLTALREISDFMRRAGTGGERITLS